MEITSVEGFLSYYDRTKDATRRLIQVIPPDQLEFAYLPGKFTVGDLIRHIAAIERYVFAEIALGNKPAYKGCGPELAKSYEEIVAYYNRLSEESAAIFRSLTKKDLERKVTTMNGTQTDLGSFLRALFVHEIHHRGALYIYLNMIGVNTPPVFGITAEQVEQFSI